MHHPEPGFVPGGFFKRVGSRDKQIVFRNLDEAAALLQRDVGPQRYELQNRTRAFLAKLQFRKLENITLSYAWFAPAMIITSTPSEPYYTLFFRLHGASEYTVRRKLFITSPMRGAFLPGMQPVHVRTQENWHVFGTLFSPDAMRRELSNLLEREAGRPLEFDPVVDFDRGAGLQAKNLLWQLYQHAAESDPETPGSTLALRQAERSLITLVLEGLGHNYSKFVNGPDRNVAPWQVRAVEEFVREHADQPISLGDLSAIGGVTGRSLQVTFRRYRGCGPMEFLRRIRFERVRDELLHADDHTTVTSAALHWGFSHLSRFAGEYRGRFGETPSTTLRRTRRLLD
jgi:AraC-like DNA-binding protein